LRRRHDLLPGWEQGEAHLHKSVSARRRAAGRARIRGKSREVSAPDDRRSWFDESQFESYSRLGYDIARTTFEPAIKRTQSTSTHEFFKTLYELWYPPSPAIESHFTKHTKVYMDIMEKLRADRDLAFLDAELSMTRTFSTTRTFSASIGNHMASLRPSRGAKDFTSRSRLYSCSEISTRI
jgi:hypothetical protein